MITYEDLQSQTNTTVTKANNLRLLSKFPPLSPLGAYRTTDRLQEAVAELVQAREDYRAMSRAFVAQGATCGNHADAMNYLDRIIAKKLAGYDGAFRAAAPDYNAGEIDWFHAWDDMPQPTPEQIAESERSHAAFVQLKAAYPPVGWGGSSLITERVARWQARPLHDRLGDPRLRDTTLPLPEQA